MFLFYSCVSEELLVNTHHYEKNTQELVIKEISPAAITVEFYLQRVGVWKNQPDAPDNPPAPNESSLVIFLPALPWTPD